MLCLVSVNLADHRDDAGLVAVSGISPLMSAARAAIAANSVANAMSALTVPNRMCRIGMPPLNARR
jgi:hypothetical protein